ncbi:MAG: hypothetical protein JNK48_29905 [Bryobacterales bacterium]|nr:hypothetical protein [Bryobacterales bacterium]
MGLDLRFPIGLLLAIVGLVLAIYGSLTDPSIYQRSLGLNINLYWGVVLLLTGAILLAAARRSARSSK